MENNDTQDKSGQVHRKASQTDYENMSRFEGIFYIGAKLNIRIIFIQTHIQIFQKPRRHLNFSRSHLLILEILLNCF